jgi:DNA-binding NtrC family response regulator
MAHPQEALSEPGLSAASDFCCSMPTHDRVQPVDRRPRTFDAGRILIVDDDQGILKLVAKMVERLGYRTTIALGVKNALRRLDKTRFELVLTDFDMPLMNGFQLAERIKKRHCDTKVIIMTGYCERAAEMMKSSNAVDALLSKPFSLNTIQQKIARVGVSLPG